MSISDSILTGSLSLGQDVTWNGESVLSDLCLYTEESTENSHVFDVTFQLEAIVNLTAVKLFMLSRDRWKAANIESNSSIQKFLSELFNEETNVCGTTKKALLIQVIKKEQDTQQQIYPLQHAKTNLIIYGEKAANSTLFVYAQPLYDDFDFLPIYESSYSGASNTSCSQNPFLGDEKEQEMILDEIFDVDKELDEEEEDSEEIRNDYIQSSAQLRPPSNKLSELEIIRRINCQVDDVDIPRDLLSEAKIAQEAKKQLIKQSRKSQQTAAAVTTPPAQALPSIQHTTHSRISKSKPSKYKPASPSAAATATSSRHHVHNNNIPIFISSQASITTGGAAMGEGSSSAKTLFAENKEVLRTLIKETFMPAEGNYYVKTGQLIYSSIRHLYGKELNSHTPVDEDKLLCLIKMHRDFYSNMENMISIFHPDTSISDD